MGKRLVAAILSVAWCVATPTAFGVELVVTGRAATMALRDAAFKRDGKYDLIPPSKCIYTYLERPEVGFGKDRVTIRLHVAAHAGKETSGQCVGAAEAFWLTVAGTPFVSGTTVGVKDVHVVQIDNPSYRTFLEAALQAALVKQLRHDVGAAVRAALARDVSQYRLTVNNLTITNLRARNNTLRATINFELVGDAPQ